MQQAMFRVTVSVKVAKVGAKMGPQGPQEFVDFAMNSESAGEGRTEKEAYEAAVAAGVGSFVDRLQAVIPVGGQVVTPFPSA